MRIDGSPHNRLTPTSGFVCCRVFAFAVKTCGSELAREGVGSGNEDVECAALFASKLAPTLDLHVAGIWHTPRKPVGASLLAKALGQAMKMLNVPPSSRAGSLPHWILRVAGVLHTPQKSVGVSLLANASGQAMKMLNVPPSSRAGSLLQGTCGEAQTCNNCRVIAIEVCSDCPVRCNLFSRLAPSQS